VTPQEKKKDYALRHKYGITIAEYNKMLKAQKGLCWICGAPPKNRGLHVDHKHLKNEKKLRKTGKQNLIRANVRGLLCWACNTGLRKWRDNADNLLKASKYLKNPPAQKFLK